MIVIPMAGLSKRFFDAGYTVPKYQLPLYDSTVFSAVMQSFKTYFLSDTFLFIIRNIYQTKEFVEQQLKQLGIKNYHIVSLEHETQGQAETVYLGLLQVQPLLMQDNKMNEPLYIFNIDTIRHDYQKPNFINACAGYLEVFEGEGTHWSFVEPHADAKHVIRTTEKNRISNLCSDGLYYFNRLQTYITAYDEMRTVQQPVQGEFYIAPMYNQLIAQNAVVYYQTVHLNQLDFCGTPNDYQALIDNKPLLKNELLS